MATNSLEEFQQNAESLWRCSLENQGNIWECLHNWEFWDKSAFVVKIQGLLPPIPCTPGRQYLQTWVFTHDDDDAARKVSRNLIQMKAALEVV